MEMDLNLYAELTQKTQCDRRVLQSNEHCPEVAEFVIVLPHRNVHSCRKCLGDAVAALTDRHAVLVERLP